MGSYAVTLEIEGRPILSVYYKYFKNTFDSMETARNIWEAAAKKSGKAMIEEVLHYLEQPNPKYENWPGVAGNYGGMDEHLSALEKGMLESLNILHKPDANPMLGLIDVTPYGIEKALEDTQYHYVAIDMETGIVTNRCLFVFESVESCNQLLPGTNMEKSKIGKLMIDGEQKFFDVYLIDETQDIIEAFGKQSFLALEASGGGFTAIAAS